MVFCIENLLQCLYGYFNHSPKRHLEFTKLVEIMEIKRNKILRNIKIKWNFMINPIKQVLSEYHILLTKMALDVATIPSIQSNIYLFINVETLLGLYVVMPLLNALHSLIKIA